jgi:hypothetical protein
MARGSSGLAEKAASIATEKAAEVAGTFIGGRAGLAAGEALRRYGPELRQQIQRNARLAQKDPVRAFAYTVAAGAVLAGLWVALNQTKKR